MKKIIIISLITFTGFVGYAQNIINPGFEAWAKETIYEYPQNYLTTNMQLSFVNGEPNVTKSEAAHGGQYAVRLETVVAMQDTIFGGIFAGDPNDPNFNVFSGIPYSGKPDSITGYAKYDVKPGDTAFIMVMLRSHFLPIAVGFASATFTGSSSDYVYFSEGVQWLSQLFTPDSVVIIISSSSINSSSAVPGSILYLDDVNFKKNSESVPAFPNGDFENWGSVITEEPEGWFTLNYASFFGGKPSATKTFDAYNGDYALRLENIDVFEDTLGFVTNGYLADGDYPKGGIALEANPATLTGYYKYIPVGLDTALAAGFHYKNNGTTTELIELNIIPLPPVAEYTKFTIDFTYDKYPVGDTFNLSFASGNFFEDGNYVGLGSVLYLDNLELTFKPNSINETELRLPVDIFPNPSHGEITVSAASPNAPSELRITDENGKEVLKKNNPGQHSHIDLRKYGKGIYFLEYNHQFVRKLIVN